MCRLTMAQPPSRTASKRMDVPSRTISNKRMEAPSRTASKRVEVIATTTGTGQRCWYSRHRMLAVRIAAAWCIALLGCFNCIGYKQQQQRRPSMLRQASTLTSDEAVFAPNNSTTDHTLASTSSSTIMVDIISVGSLTKPTFQDAQLRTFGSHAAVRNFFRITEEDDADQACPTQLTMDQLHDVQNYCGGPEGQHEGESLIRTEMRTRLFKPKEHTGWLCAQKRPIDGLHKVLQRYREEATLTIPDYVFVLDDDTYANMDSMLDLLSNNFAATAPQVKTGCVFDFLYKSGFKFPYGGFGSFLSRQAIKRLLQPLQCSSTQNENNTFARLACARLQQNLLGEAPFFLDGMSVSDLMYQFGAQQAFGNAGNWTKGAGFCMHSDHALAYFFNYYHIAATEQQLQWLETDLSNKKALRDVAYEAITDTRAKASRGECNNLRQACDKNNHVCHYIEPDQMDALYLDTKLQRMVDTSTDMQHGLELIESVAPETVTIR